MTMGRVLRRWLALAALAACVASGSTGALAQESGSRVAIVEMNRILSEASALRSIQAQGEAQRRTYAEDAEAETRRLQQVQEEIKRQETLLSSEALAKRMEGFRNEVRAADRMTQERSRILRRAVRRGEDAFRVTLLKLIEEVANERGLDVVIPVNMSLYAAPDVNITDEIISRINDEAPQITLSFEES